jgi:hypothetical protein
MWLRPAIALSLFAILSGAAPAWADRLVCDRQVEDFANDTTGSWPKGWRERDGLTPAEATLKTRVAVETAGTFKAMRVTYASKAITVGRQVPGWDLQRYPILQWRWQAVRLPKGGDETRSGRNDVAASVYVFWKAAWPFRVHSLKFTWSSTLPAGTHHDRGAGHYHVKVVESGSGHMGQWQTAQVDVFAEHLLRFGENLGEPIGIAVLTDGDDTESPSEALYAEFRLCRKIP